MTLDIYKDGRGKYRLVVFTEKYGVETFRIKGKKDLEKKKKAIKLLYREIKVTLPDTFKPFKILGDSKEILASYRSEVQRDKEIKRLKPLLPTSKITPAYQITAKDME